jgi:iron-sulfur cluster assembly 2
VFIFTTCHRPTLQPRMLRSVVSTLLIRQRRLLAPAVVWRKIATTVTRLHTHKQNFQSAETIAIHGSLTCRSMVVVTNTRSTELNQASPSSSSAPILTSAATATLPASSASISSDQKVFVTDSCWRRIRQLLAAKQESLSSSGNTLYLRVFVDAGGCSGFTYQFELDHDDNLDQTEDVVFRQPNVDDTTATKATTATTATTASPRVVVDRTSLQYIAGSKIDYVQEMIKSSFEVRDNPQSESACGCGSSFALKNFTSNPALD